MSRKLAAALAALAIAAIAVLLALATTRGDSSTEGSSSTEESASTSESSSTEESPPTPGRSFVVYAEPTRAQFVSHNDDRERGDIANPFDPDSLPNPRNANSAKEGARAGDNALFSLKLYSDPQLKRPVGGVVYSCTFNFAEEAICSASFNLNGGTMIAQGPATLDGKPIVLPVIGGTSPYAGAHGQMTSAPSGTKNTQIIRFRLL